MNSAKSSPLSEPPRLEVGRYVLMNVTASTRTIADAMCGRIGRVTRARCVGGHCNVRFIGCGIVPYQVAPSDLTTLYAEDVPEDVRASIVSCAGVQDALLPDDVPSAADDRAACAIAFNATLNLAAFHEQPMAPIVYGSSPFLRLAGHGVLISANYSTFLPGGCTSLPGGCKCAAPPDWHDATLRLFHTVWNRLFRAVLSKAAAAGIAHSPLAMPSAKAKPCTRAADSDTDTLRATVAALAARVATLEARADEHEEGAERFAAHVASRLARGD